MAKDNPLMNIQIRVTVFRDKFGVLFPQLTPVASLSVDLVEF